MLSDKAKLMPNIKRLKVGKLDVDLFHILPYFNRNLKIDDKASMSYIIHHFFLFTFYEGNTKYLLECKAETSIHAMIFPMTQTRRDLKFYRTYKTIEFMSSLHRFILFSLYNITISNVILFALLDIAYLFYSI